MKKTILLGAETAEADSAMLQQAFYEPAVFRELLTARGYRIVVGRRGAGKSAICGELIRRQRPIEHRHEDHIFASLRDLLHEDLAIGTYQSAKMVLRVAWRLQILLEAARHVVQQQRVASRPEVQALALHLQHVQAHDADRTGLAGVLQMLRGLVADQPGLRPSEVPEELVSRFSEKKLTTLLKEACDAGRVDVTLTFDGLDEGWVASPVATGVIGGLVRACADLAERVSRIRNIVFIRDSMLRSVAFSDDDYARDIEGNTLRLDWSWEALFKLLAERLRIALNLNENSSAKLWNRLVDGPIQGQDGFRSCLKRTMLRPRDLIQLLNDSSRNASKHERDRILEEDIFTADTKWSNARLDDLIKEYSDVFPGLRELTNRFRASSDTMNYRQVLTILQAFVDSAPAKASGLAGILSDAQGAFRALFSVGFIGLIQGNDVSFTYDGSQTIALDQISDSDEVIVHACYWTALRIVRTERTENLLLDDTYDSARSADGKQSTLDVRVRMLGERADELEQIPIDVSESVRLDKWALSAARAVLSAWVGPIEIRRHAKSDHLARLVGEIATTQGLFQRIRLQYSASQIVIQCLNTPELTAQSLSIARSATQGVKCGQLVFVLRRAPYDEPTLDERRLIVNTEKGSVRVVVLPTQILQGALKRLRANDVDGRQWLLKGLERSFNRHEKYWRKANDR